MAWQDGLNDLQKAAIGSSSTSHAVVAGPGTGKTKTILHKALQLIEEENTQSDKIRIVNFTNAGVFDLQKRISSDPTYSSIDSDRVTTFHSLALRILRAVRAKTVPVPLVMLDKWEEENLIDRFAKHKLELRDVRVAKSRREDYNSRWCIASEEANQWLSVGERRAYEGVYTLAKDLLGMTAQGELTFLWWRWLRANPGMDHAAIGFPWTHLLVDEYQDLNPCEHDILQMLASAGVRIFAVGDPNQSIYETLRHAHPEFCWQFPERVPGGELSILQESYRCPSEVLNISAALLGHTKGVPSPDLAPAGGQVHILAFASDTAERSGLALIAKNLLRRFPSARIMFTVPQGSLARPFAKELANLGVKVDDRTQEKEQTSEQCRLANALLRFLKEPRDSVAAATAIILRCPPTTRPARLVELLGVGEQQGRKIADILTSQVALPPRLEAAREEVNKMLADLKGSTDIAKSLSQLTGCAETADTAEEIQTRLERVLAQTEQLEPGRVTIMTLHASKGTEAEWVLISAVEPGFLERDLVGAAKEERRRLLYVGITRAANGVFLSYTARRFGPTRYGDPTGASPRKGPSVFIDEICDRTGRPPEQATEFLQGFLGT